MGRIILYNQIYQGNTEKWYGDVKTGYDGSEAMGWAMTTRMLVGLEYKVSKTMTIFVREEFFYGTITDNETRFVPDNEQSGDSNQSTERTAHNPANRVANTSNNEAGIAYGTYFKKIGYYNNRFYAGYSLKLTNNVTFINQYICETGLNPEFDPESKTQADRIQVTGINHYVFIGAVIAMNLY